MRLQPDLPEALFARGYVAYVQGDLRGALEDFRLAQEGAPNDAVTAAFTGYTYRRLGAWEEWEDTWRRTLELNPRNVDMYYNLGAGTLQHLDRFREALASLDGSYPSEQADSRVQSVLGQGIERETSSAGCFHVDVADRYLTPHSRWCMMFPCTLKRFPTVTLDLRS